MHDAIDDDSICSVDLKQNTIITDSKPVFRRVVCELLHISLQIVLKLIQRIRDPGRLSFFDSPKVLDSFRLEGKPNPVGGSGNSTISILLILTYS